RLQLCGRRRGALNSDEIGSVMGENIGVSSWFFACGGVFGAIGVASGALGAHVLKERFDGATLEIYTTAVSYLLVHSVVLLVCGAVLRANESKRWFKFAGNLLIVGILLFCGGLITRAVTGIPTIGKVVPIGGMALILAWLAIAVGGITGVGKPK
ncbi:MAG TPA: DUF423 domain-containing protein, partial [Gammaproteobacteria bacterium]|nr:DUF423 domain-containing protein [Gammaproteobacteria bacterium]